MAGYFGDDGGGSAGSPCARPRAQRPPEADGAAAGRLLANLIDASSIRPAPHDSQPWRLVWARRGTARFTAVTALMAGRPSWADDASAFGLLAANRRCGHADRPAPLFASARSFDPVSAWLGVAIGKRISGFYTRGAAGLDWDGAARELEVPEDFSVEAAIAIGAVRDGRRDILVGRETERSRLN